MQSNSIPLTLEPPGTILYTAEMALAGHRLNMCALSLKRPHNRQTFLADPDAYMTAAGLSAAEKALVQARDWTGLLQAGGHVQAILFFAATVGETLVHIGSHNAGMAAEEMLRVVPRHVTGLPPSLPRARTPG